MKFPYKRYTVASSTGTGDEEIFRPMAALRIIGPSGDAFLWALLDTGADETILPRSIGDAIGLTFGKQPAWTVGGIGGQTIQVYSVDVTMRIEDGMETFEWNANIAFADFADPKDEATILGHAGCLNFFRASFDGELREVELVPTFTFPGSVTRLLALVGGILSGFVRSRDRLLPHRAFILQEVSRPRPVPAESCPADQPKGTALRNVSESTRVLQHRIHPSPGSSSSPRCQ